MARRPPLVDPGCDQHPYPVRASIVVRRRCAYQAEEAPATILLLVIDCAAPRIRLYVRQVDRLCGLPMRRY